MQMNHIKNIWKCFEEKHSAIAKWLYQIFYFVIFSMGVTVFQYLVFTFLPGILGIGLAGTEFMWPKVSMNLFGVKFTWSLLGYNVLRDATGNILIGGGLGYFISYELGSFLAQCINFPLQRNITFKSHGNPVYQAIWYFVAWVVISLICNGFNNLWMPVASAYVAPAVYNMLVTIITGGVSMVIFFFVFKIIFPEGTAWGRYAHRYFLFWLLLRLSLPLPPLFSDNRHVCFRHFSTVRHKLPDHVS